MSFDQSFLAPEASRYLEGLLDVPYRVMALIEEEARKENQPAVGRQAGSLLRGLVLAHRSARVLEVGCNLGYSALWMAAGLPPGGRLETIEINDDLASRAESHFRDAGVGDRARVLRGAALDVLPRLEARAYDLVFLDAVKAEYPQYLDHALRLLRPGGLVVADNMFWLGRAWDPEARHEDDAGVREYTRRIFADARLTSTIVPVEDGLAVSVLRAEGKP